jgi:hypothetical protein
VARVVAETLIHGGAWIDRSPAELSRFDDRELDPAGMAPEGARLRA